MWEGRRWAWRSDRRHMQSWLLPPSDPISCHPHRRVLHPTAARPQVQMERSLFERLQAQGAPVKMLSVQYRMHAAIRQVRATAASS